MNRLSIFIANVNGDQLPDLHFSDGARENAPWAEWELPELADSGSFGNDVAAGQNNGPLLMLRNLAR